MNQNLPNFFIVGAAKSGTTSVYNYLTEHPDIYMSPIKEPNYFSTDIRLENFRSTYKKVSYINFEEYFSVKPLKFLHIAYVEKAEDYKKLFLEAKSQKIRGEISNSYLFSKIAAEEIKQEVPDAKILMLLRNPIERAYSHYLMDLRAGYTSDTFREAIEKDFNKEDKGWGISSLYIELGMYATQLKRYLKVFPREQVKVMFFDDLKKDQLSFLQDIYLYLNIDGSQVDEEQLMGTHNKSRIPKFKKIFHFLKNLPGMSKIIKILPKNIHVLLEKIFLANQVPKLSQKDREYFYSYFEQEIIDLENLLQCDLSNWKIQ